jgi:hypothetical protein
MKHKSFARVLAVDLHPRHFGYVILEGPDRLLDWGVRRTYQKTKRHPQVLAREGLCPLLKTWMPDVVITRIRERRDKNVRELFRQTTKEVGITPFLLMLEFQDHYLGLGKYGRAVALAARFPEIGWKLPLKRKPWDSEHYSMSIFEALAIAAAYGGGNVPK